jgi:hypothetical protein
MRRVRMALKIILIIFATLVVLGFWAVYYDIPNSFVMIRNLYVSAEARSIEKHREAIGLDPRQWQTPKNKIFQQDALNRICEAIANADSAEVNKLLSQQLDINEIGADGLTILFFAYMEGDFPSFVKLLERGARPDIPISKELSVLPGRVAPQKGATILIVAPHTYGRYHYFDKATKHIEALQNTSTEKVNTIKE